MKLFILYENEEWMLPIRAALHKLDIPYIDWHIDEITYIDYDTPPPQGVFWNRMSPSSHLRGRSNFAQKTSHILRWLELYDRQVINGYSSWQLEINKMQQYLALIDAGINVPRTISVFSPEEITNAAMKIGFPVIIKHNCGGRGEGVEKLDNAKELSHFVEQRRSQSPDGILLVQEYIASSEPYIIRVEMIGGSMVYAVKVSTELGYNLCPADSCASSLAQICPASGNMERFSILSGFQSHVLKRYQEFMQRNNIEIAGIEMVISRDGEIYTYDVNMNTNYNSQAEQNTGHNANETLALFLRSKLGDAHSLPDL